MNVNFDESVIENKKLKRLSFTYQDIVHEIEGTHEYR